jgi:hypothetical protein
MDWKNRAPRGVEGIRTTPSGFEARVSMPSTDDGFVGRQCPDCDRRFTVDGATWDALPDDARVTCCYCGWAGDPGAFVTSDQTRRAEAAALALGAEYADQMVRDMFRGVASRFPAGGPVQVTVNEPRRGPIASLPEYVEEQARRIVECSRCSTRYGVVGAIAYCPLCGLRGAGESLADAIAASRGALALEDSLDESTRETVRAEGVFDGFAADAIKQVVTLFELAAKADFAGRVAGADAILKRQPGNVFQRLDDVERLYRDHAQINLPDLVSAQRWQRLRVVFQQRHVLVHLGGHVDQRYLDRVPGTHLTVGQRLVLSRAAAAQALTDLEQAVGVLART